MNSLWNNFKQNFWPISAIIFCPCHLPLTMTGVASLTAGTFIGSFISTYYSSIESVLAVTFSFYFVVAFMIWVVRGPQQKAGMACVIDEQGHKHLAGLSTKNILTWGIIGMFITPALVSVSFFAQKDIIPEADLRLIIASMDYNSGLVWLLSITMVVMIPVMVIWLVWLWLAWSKTDLSRLEGEDWNYEYE
ncbi:MAG: hypothetical protein KDF65_06695 [Anaerolineae bacterium]|nr:hypothetical protein [Anaerolineae bacterium]